MQWAKVYNLKQMSETFLFMREQHMYMKTDTAVARFHELNDSIKSAESRMAANLAMQRHIQNYAKTRYIYAAYRKSGYSKKFFGGIGRRSRFTRQRRKPLMRSERPSSR